MNAAQTDDWLTQGLTSWVNEWMNEWAVEWTNQWIRAASRKIQNECRATLFWWQTDGARWLRKGKEKPSATCATRLCSVFLGFPAPPLLLYTHFRRLSPLSRLWFGGIKVNSSQRDAMRRGAARVKPSHSSFEMPAACAAVVTALRPVATPPNSQTAHAHIEWERERAGVG